MTKASPKNQSGAPADKDNFEMYYQHQFERMAQLEQQRLTMTNLIIGLSVLSFTLAFTDLSKLNIVNALGLPTVVIVTNLIAIIYNSRSRVFIKMHQARAEKSLEIYAPGLSKIDKDVPKPVNSNKDIFRRARLQDYLHWSLIIIAILPMLVYFKVIAP